MARTIVRAGRICIVIIIPIILFIILLYGINQSLTAQIESVEEAGVQEKLFDEARTHRQLGRLPEADAIYMQIISKQAGTPAALDAARERVLMYIEADDMASVTTAIQDLATGFSTDPEYPKALLLIGDKFRQLGQHAQAQAMYQLVKDAYPQGETAVWSRMGEAMADIAMGKYSDAKSATADLLATLSLAEHTPNAACQIADAWRKKGKYAEAKSLYEYVVNERPDAEHALWSQMGLVISDIALKNDPNAAQGVQQLLQRYPKDNRMANAACQIADRFQDTGDHAMAKALYLYVVSAWPSEEHAIWCQKGLAVSEEKTDPNSVEHLDRLLANFSGHADLPLAAFLVGEGYRDAAMNQLEQGKYGQAVQSYQRAVQAWEHIIKLQPETAYTPEAFYILAECSYMSGQYNQALYYYQYVTEKWPDFKLAWHSQFMVGYRYQELKQAKVIDQETADIQTAAAYNAVLATDPNCPAAKAATTWLKQNGI